MANIIKQPCDEAVIRSAPCISPCSRNVGRWVLAATILGSSMAMIDGTVVNVALPVLQSQLNATTTDVQWIVESYALFLAALILVGGSLGDRFGRRLIFAIGIVLFALASVWCGLSPNVNQLIIARAVQGIGGALLVPGSLAIISASFSTEQRGQAIGTWSGFTAITSALGPVLGGWLVENVSWRWIFFLNVPLAVIVLSILLWQVPESRDEESARLDWWGAALVTLGLGTIVYGLIESSHLGLLHPLVLGCLIVGALILSAFIFVEANNRAPMMPLSLFKSRTFSGANLLTLLLYSALGGVFYFVPFNLIQVQRYSATAAGAVFLPFILIMFVLSRWSGGLVSRYGAKLPLTIGPIIAAVGFALFALPGVGGSYWTTFFPAILVLGLGMAISVAPLTTTVMNTVKQRQAGIASGINNAVARTAGLLGIAVLNIFVFNTFNRSLDQRLTRLNIPTEVQKLLDNQRIKLAGAEVPSSVSAEVSTQLKQAIALAFVDSFRLVMFIAFGLALASAMIAALMIANRKKQHT
ncbi:MFS transporter [Iningainema tapete]|uniref:MFS transporter n=1 Tax=Iningainema tapete BLCC-T55 TaxID=2748662 RepID=A0A8J6XJG9_9CYAN|nr:MFS transporter [Iningainema tapete]MBD2774190.1 MFS transporter [Iningainema tapete BLCC-T55]